MSDPERDQQSRLASGEAAPAVTESDEEDEDDASSPFDHPFFLPVLLWGLALWFGYDGWFNEAIEAKNFNKIGFGFLVAAGIYFTVQALREQRRREGGPRNSPEGPDPRP